MPQDSSTSTRRDGIVHFGAQNPTHPWWHVADRIVERLLAMHRILPASVCVVSARSPGGAQQPDRCRRRVARARYHDAFGLGPDGRGGDRRLQRAARRTASDRRLSAHRLCDLCRRRSDGNHIVRATRRGALPAPTGQRPPQRTWDRCAGALPRSRRCSSSTASPTRRSKNGVARCSSRDRRILAGGCSSTVAPMQCSKRRRCCRSGRRSTRPRGG